MPPVPPVPASDLGAPPAPQYAAPQFPPAEPQPVPVYAPPQPGYAPPPAPGYGAAPGYAAPGAPGYAAPPPASGYPTPQGVPYGAGGYPAQQRTNPLAIVSFVAGLCFIIPGLNGIAWLVAIITGFISLNQIRRTAERGRGFAIAGVVIGFATVLLGIIFAVILVAVFASNPQLGNQYSSSSM